MNQNKFLCETTNIKMFSVNRFIFMPKSNSLWYEKFCMRSRFFWNRETRNKTVTIPRNSQPSQTSHTHWPRSRAYSIELSKIQSFIFPVRNFKKILLKTVPCEAVKKRPFSRNSTKTKIFVFDRFDSFRSCFVDDKDPPSRLTRLSQALSSCLLLFLLDLGPRPRPERFPIMYNHVINNNTLPRVKYYTIALFATLETANLMKLILISEFTRIFISHES